eukprot:scaffold1134_cov295-Prasinococcus_capsulatus_cf.AAC.10
MRDIPRATDLQAVPSPCRFSRHTHHCIVRLSVACREDGSRSSPPHPAPGDTPPSGRGPADTAAHPSHESPLPTRRTTGAPLDVIFTRQQLVTEAHVCSRHLEGAPVQGQNLAHEAHVDVAAMWMVLLQVARFHRSHSFKQGLGRRAQEFFRAMPLRAFKQRHYVVDLQPRDITALRLVQSQGPRKSIEAMNHPAARLSGQHAPHRTRASERGASCL